MPPLGAVAGALDLQFAAATAPDVSADEASSLPRDVPTSATGLPLLESRTGGAGLEIFLDFARDVDGRGTFSLDADRVNFSPTEGLAIYNCWHYITGFISQFNINVTTALPPTGGADLNFAWLQITNDWVGGNAYVNSLTKSGPTGRRAIAADPEPTSWALGAWLFVIALGRGIKAVQRC